MAVIELAPETALRKAKQGKDSRKDPESGVKYRPDIDGLRAVAVLSVLAFHIGLGRFQGGFVGVDVFFVISGYLISSIIFAEINESRFTIVGFYERRIRRIFPALFVMLGVSGLLALLYLLPGELIDFAKSLLSATCSTSNLFFWKHSGYFDAPSSNPLLHTWSLAVEEQFYLSFPVLLLLVRRFFPGRMRAVVVLLFFASLVTSCAVVLRHQNAAFYMPYSRAWELLLGTLLSLRILRTLQSAPSRNLVALAGMGMILWPVLFYSQQTLFPGFNALLPCVGSALIIWAGEGGGSIVTSILSWRPMVFVGLISYSLYLWHWPIIVLRRMGMLVGLGGISLGGHSLQLSSHRFDMLIEVLVSFLLAILSWKFVEAPFRSGSLRLSGRPLFALAVGVMVVFLGGGSWVVLAQGLPDRFSEKSLQVASAIDPQQAIRSMRTGTCFITTEDDFKAYDFGACLHEDKQKKNYLLLGDSHSAMLWSALASNLKDSNVMQASSADCVPSLAPSGSEDCRKMMAYIFQSYLPAHRIQGLFLAGRWEQKDLGSLTALIAWAKRRQLPVTVFGPVPEYDAPLPRLLAYSIAWNRPDMAGQHLVEGGKAVDAQMRQMAAAVWHAPYISLYDAICSADTCLEFADPAHTMPLMGDDNHLSEPGASLIVQRLIRTGELN